MTRAEELPAMSAMTSPILGRNAYLEELQRQRPVWKVRTHTGDEAWLVVGYEEIRKLMVDRRLGRSHPDPAAAAKYAPGAIFEVIMVEFRDHAQFRPLLAPHFSRARMRLLEPRIQAIVEELADELVAHGAPADLQALFARQLSVRVLCELIGIPREDSDAIEPMIYRMATDPDPIAVDAGPDTLVGYLCRLAAVRRVEPRDDMTSGLIEAGQSDYEIAKLVGLLLVAGLDSVAVNIGFGVARLASMPGMRERLAADPALVPAAVEELLRTNTFGGGAQPHYANADIEIGGVTIREGDLVLPDFALANFDPRAFTDPTEIDLTREPNTHLTFAHGIWHCLGAPLARMELQAAFTVLLTRMPGIKLAKPLEELNPGAETIMSSLPVLLVEW